MENSKIIKAEPQVLSPHHKLFIERENHCPLCNNQLKIKVKTYLENFNVAEEAYCHQCDLVTRTKNHRIN